MEILTYSLRDGNPDSEEFYQVAEHFASVVERHCELQLGPAAMSFLQFIRRTEAEPEQTRAEYSFELLTLGVLWRIYSPSAGSLKPWQGRLLHGLVGLRYSSTRLKPAADRIRGILGSRWLTPDRIRLAPAMYHSESQLKQLNRLLLWLEASGEFRQEADRFRRWQLYLEQLPDRREVSLLLQTTQESAEWFEEASEAALGRYTRRVNHYRLLRQPKHASREDALLVNRRRTEYHLNLVGAEVMNRAYRSSYKKTERKAVLLPACLKGRSGIECAATRSGQPLRCLRCSTECRIGAISVMSQSDGFELIIAPHESDAFSQEVVDRLVREQVGIVGVACALQLLAGGLRSKALGIPAQCVILDYSGCREHWDELGFPTDLNLHRLRRMLRPE